MKKKMKTSAHVRQALGADIKVSVAETFNKQFEV
jgi:hypothetical protein